MTKIEKVEVRLVLLPPKTKRTDAIQSFDVQETPMVTITDSDGATGTGYCYTIGTGGKAVMSLLRETLVPAIIGQEANNIEMIWKRLLFRTHATSVGAITSLAMAAIDVALWDLRCRRAKMPLWQMAGGAQADIPVYSTEGGWLNLTSQELVDDALARKEEGFTATKIKIGAAHGEDRRRLMAVRDAVGDGFDIFTDGNQGFTRGDAIRRAAILAEAGIGWFEEPLPADDVEGHALLARSTSVPVAVGESLYSLSQFREYLSSGAASVIQVDVARIGGITPWLKVARLAEAFNVDICPHFLMELHLPLVCATSAGKWLEYIPQLDLITESEVQINNGRAIPSDEPGLGITWDMQAIEHFASGPSEQFRD